VGEKSIRDPAADRDTVALRRVMLEKRN